MTEVILPHTATHRHLTRSDARTDAAANNLDLDDLHIYKSPKGVYGWMNRDEAEKLLHPSDDAVDAEVVAASEPAEGFAVDIEQDDETTPEAIAARQATRVLAVEPVIMAHAPSSMVEAFGMQGLVDAGLVTVDDEPGVDDAPGDDQEAAPRAAQDGDVILTVGGPMLPAAALLEAKRLARKLGLPVTMLDALTMEVKGVEGPSAGGPTEHQKKLIELCSRRDFDGNEIGATGKELLDAGASPPVKKGTPNWRGLCMAVERHGYKFRLKAEIDDKQRLQKYYILTKAVANDDTAQSAATE
jgi:hypothetical protein